jgi:drug/metabolite transporter (DMT)-like permease
MSSRLPASDVAAMISGVVNGAPPHDTRSGTALGVVAILLWGSTVAFGRSLSAQLGPIHAAAAVYALCGALSLAYLLWRPGRIREALGLPPKYLAFCGALFVLYVICFYLALGLATGPQQAIEVGIINYLWPAATVVLSVPLLGTRARWTLVPGAAVAVAGIVLATLPVHDWSARVFVDTLRANRAPYLLALVAALDWALYSNLSRRWAAGGGANAVPVFMVVTAAVMGLLAWFQPAVEARWSTRTILELGYLGIFPTTLGYAFWEIAMRRGNLVRVATISYFTPLISAVVAALYLRTVPGAGLWLGCALVVVGAWLCQAAGLEPTKR